MYLVCIPMYEPKNDLVFEIIHQLIVIHIFFILSA